MELNLNTKTPEEKLIKEYLEKNASEVLAEKINNGVHITKDGKTFISKKTLEAFMKYAANEARRQTEKGAQFACVDNQTVFGWAIHYFEEDSIEGLLFNEDGTEYKPAIAKPKVEGKPAVVAPKKPRSPSLFDIIDEQKKQGDQKIFVCGIPSAKTDIYDLSDF